MIYCYGTSGNISSLFWLPLSNYTAGIRLGAIVQPLPWWKPLVTSISSSNVPSTQTLAFISQWKDLTRSINTSRTPTVSIKKFINHIAQQSHISLAKIHKDKLLNCFLPLLEIPLYKLPHHKHHRYLSMKLRPCQEPHWESRIRLWWVSC